VRRAPLRHPIRNTDLSLEWWRIRCNSQRNTRNLEMPSISRSDHQLLTLHNVSAQKPHPDVAVYSFRTFSDSGCFSTVGRDHATSGGDPWLTRVRSFLVTRSVELGCTHALGSAHWVRAAERVDGDQESQIDHSQLSRCILAILGHSRPVLASLIFDPGPRHCLAPS